MIWATAEAIYFAIGGCLSLAVAPAHVGRSDARHATADVLTVFILIFGIILLWPVLLALAIDQSGQR